MSEPIVLDRNGFIEQLEFLLENIPAGSRRIVAIAGAPASGKSTLTEEAISDLSASSPGSAIGFGLDGFHFDDEALNPKGWRPRKGAPHTFDVGGLRATLERLRRNDEPFVAVPRFDRTIEIARAGALLIENHVRLIIVEGNYLLLGEAPWDSLAPLFDVTAMIQTPEADLVERTRQRWIAHGLDSEGIRQKIEENDIPNGRLVYARSRVPDWVIHNGIFLTPTG